MRECKPTWSLTLLVVLPFFPSDHLHLQWIRNLPLCQLSILCQRLHHLLPPTGSLPNSLRHRILPLRKEGCRQARPNGLRHWSQRVGRRRNTSREANYHPWKDLGCYCLICSLTLRLRFPICSRSASHAISHVGHSFTPLM